MDTTLVPVPGYLGIFATAEGRIYSNRRGKMRELKGSDHCGYTRVRLSSHRDGSADTGRKFVHELVMLAFVGQRPEGLVTRHLNGDPSDNSLSNLRYGTYRENREDARHHHRIPVGLANGRAYVPDETVRAVVAEIRAGAQQRATAKKYGIHEGLINAWLSGRARGYALRGETVS